MAKFEVKDIVDMKAENAQAEGLYVVLKVHGEVVEIQEKATGKSRRVNEKELVGVRRWGTIDWPK